MLIERLNGSLSYFCGDLFFVFFVIVFKFNIGMKE